VPEEAFNLLDDPPVEKAQRKVHRAHPFAFVTLHTAAGKMEGPAQVEDVLLRQFDTDVDPQPVVPLKHAGRTVAAGAHLAAGIAADAAVELTKPELQPLRGIQGFDLLQSVVLIVDQLDLRRLTEQDIVEYGETVGAAGAPPIQLTVGAVHAVAGYPDGEQPLSIDLLFRQKHIERSAVAGLYDDGDARGGLSSLWRLLLIVEVRHQVVEAGFTPYEAVDLARIVDERGASAAARADLVADDTVHPIIL
jgi:hypothetical protein